MLSLELQQRLERGLDALARADFSTAIDELGDVAAADPANASVWRALGVCYLETRRPELAEEALRRAVAADPADPNAHCVLGHAQGTLGQLEQAAASYRQALAIDPHHAKAEEFLMRTEALLESREHFRRGLKLLYGAEPDLDDLNQAMRELVQSTAIFPESPARDNLADCGRMLLERRQDRVIEVEPELGYGLWAKATERGYHCIAGRNWIGAREAYQEALELRVGDAFVHHALGFAMLNLGYVDDAVRAWLRTVELDSAYDFSCFGRVRLERLQ